nr:reverse transcriptase family protein [Fodinicola acaciae]
MPAHPAAHGFVAGRSALTHARLHAGRDVVVRLDLRQYFATVTAGRVYGVLRTIGYAEPVAHQLAGLLTTTTPAAVRDAAAPPSDPGLAAAHRWLCAKLATAHLPQGAPTSPALANLCAYRLDATYSRYADDLTFSGDRRMPAEKLVRTVEKICTDEGFHVNSRKTVIARAGVRQLVGGLVVNDRPNATRAERDRLRAILHDASTNGLDAANRHGHPDFANHLLGRISWVAAANPDHGARLRAAFDALIGA